MKLTLEDPKINQILYPMDNSHNNCLTKKEEFPKRLAGMYNVPALACKIISLPYIKEINTCIGLQKYEFVLVQYEQDIYEVLNLFHESLEDMLKQSIDHKRICDQIYWY